MLFLAFFLIFAAIVGAIFVFVPMGVSSRPTLKIDPNATDPSLSSFMGQKAPPQKKSPLSFLFSLIGSIAIVNLPLTVGPLGRRISKDLTMAKMSINPSQFILIKEAVFILTLFFLLSMMPREPQAMIFTLLMSIGAGYYLPEFWLKARVRGIKDAIVRDLPDTVDLLGLCVNAGLDFMMALKYVIEKSNPSVIIEEMRLMIQEINVGKPRRDALRDMARKYDLQDLHTFARTLIQADRMGTSVSEALNILSEDMREARYRRGEAMALKAPLKMLIPLLLFIFPVVAILVAGPVFLDFFQNNPLQNLGK